MYVFMYLLWVYVFVFVFLFFKNEEQKNLQKEEPITSSISSYCNIISFTWQPSKQVKTENNSIDDSDDCFLLVSILLCMRHKLHHLSTIGYGFLYMSLLFDTLFLTFLQPGNYSRDVGSLYSKQPGLQHVLWSYLFVL